MKTISAELLAHKRGQVTTLCQLMRVECGNGTLYGFTDLDQDVTYDDGNGPLLYEAAHGFMPSALSAQGGLSVDNADLAGLVAYVETGITAQDVRAGKLDYAQVSIYQVNYADLTMGHEWMGHGTLGEVTVQDGLIKSEFRSLSQTLKQSVCDLYSLTCRAQYGDDKCGATLDWIDATVTSVGSDPTSQFTASGLAQAADYFDPGVITWVTGNNAGKVIEVDTFGAGGVIQLLLQIYYPIQVGDTFQIRIDCPKTPAACKDARRDRWPLYFRGEPLIPVADAVQVPGANT